MDGGKLRPPALLRLAVIKHRENVKAVQKRLGHSKPLITLDTYTNLWLDEEDTWGHIVGAVLDNVPPMRPAWST